MEPETNFWTCPHRRARILLRPQLDSYDLPTSDGWTTVGGVSRRPPHRDSNFLFLNAHGFELEQLYVIPKGVRIIMFCMSKELLLSNEFDEYNWEHILLDPSASKNYYNFLTAASGHPSMRNHFNVYEEGDIVRNLCILPDDNFREGLYHLPVTGYVYQTGTNDLVLSDTSYISEAHNDRKSSHVTRVGVDRKRMAGLLKDKKNIGVIRSRVTKIDANCSLSSLIHSTKHDVPGFTALLMVCRTRDPAARKTTGGLVDVISKGRPVFEELKRLDKTT
jgi:hypothetical protein